MKATTVMSAVAGALLLGAIAFAGSDTKQTTKPAVTHKVSRMTEHQAKGKTVPAPNVKKGTKAAMKQTSHPGKKGNKTVTKVASRKTTTRRGIHHVKHQSTKTEAQKQAPKKS